MATKESSTKTKSLKKIAITPWLQKKNLCEIGQATGVHYAFLSSKADGYKQCHQWIKCRDFLHDALRNQTLGKKDVIYGFTYENGVNPPIDTKKMRIMVKQINGDTRETVDKGLAIIHCVEKHHNIKPLSKLYKADYSEKGVYIFEGAKDWIESTFMVSLYTYFIRLGAKNMDKFKNKEELDASLKKLCKQRSDHDIIYLNTVNPFLDKILKNRKKMKYVRRNGSSLFDKQSIDLFHGYTGIVALCDMAKNKNPRAGNNQKLEELIKLSEHIQDKSEDTEVPKQMQKV